MICDLYDLIIITTHVIKIQGYPLQIGNVTFGFSTFFNYQAYVIFAKITDSGDDMSCDEQNYTELFMFRHVLIIE